MILKESHSLVMIICQKIYQQMPYWCNSHVIDAIFFFPVKIPQKFHGLHWNGMDCYGRGKAGKCSKMHQKHIETFWKCPLKNASKCIKNASLSPLSWKKVSWKILIHICSMWHIIKYDKIVRPTNVKCVISNCKGQEMSLWHTLELFKLTLGLIWK